MTTRPRPAERRRSRPIPTARDPARAWLLVLGLGLLLAFALAAGCDEGGSSANDDTRQSPVDDPPADDPPADDPPTDDPPADDPPVDDPPVNPSRVERVSPDAASARGGTEVRIETSGFSVDFRDTLPGVTFADVAAGAVSAIDATTLNATLPPLAPATVTVGVAGPAYAAGFEGFRVVAPAAPGEVIVNEALPNPGGFDASRDASQSNRDDEFVELLNLRDTPVDLSAFGLRDASTLRHAFPNPTVVPGGGALVVFGAGDLAASVPAFAPAHANGHAQTASTGNLSLNNGGDTLTLDDPDGAVIDTVELGAATAGVSLNREPDGKAQSTPVAHSGLAGARPDPTTGGEFSPGLRAEQAAW